MATHDRKSGARDRAVSTADVDALWILPGEREGETLFAETWRRALALARQTGARDAQDAAGEALVHLMKRLREAPERFQLEDRGWDLNGFRPWARVVLRNHLLSQARRLVAGRQVLSGDDRVLSALNRGHDPLEPSSGLEDPHQRVRAWEGTVLLLLAVVALPPARRDLVLGVMGGFSSGQLKAHVGYASGSARVVLTQSRANVRAWLEDEQVRSRIPQPPLASSGRGDCRAGAHADHPDNQRAVPPREVRGDHRAFTDRLTPDDDPPLVERGTPCIEYALRHQADAPGDRLLEALYALETLLRLTFFCRLAGFWDSVIAACQDRTVLDVRLCIRAAVRVIEQHLSSGTDTWMDLTDSRARGISSPGNPAANEAIMGRNGHEDELNELAAAGEEERSSDEDLEHPPEAAGAACWGGLSSDDLFRLIEYAPAAAMTLLLDEPVVQRTLARGRASLGLPAVEAIADGSVSLPAFPVLPVDEGRRSPQAGAFQAVTRPLEPAFSDLASTLWRLAKAWLGGAGRWLTFPAPAAVPMRRANAASSASAPLIATLGPTPDAHLEHHCLVWQVEGSRLRLAYPRLPSDPTRGAALPGLRVVLRAPAGAPARCLVTWLEEPVPPALLAPTPERAMLLQTWLEAKLEAGTLEGVHLYRIVVSNTAPEVVR